MTTTELSAQINDLLRPMGITRNMSAYSTLQQCLELICEQEDRLQAVEKDIYTPIADRKQCDPKAIQSTIHRAAKVAWATNPELVQQLALTNQVLSAMGKPILPIESSTVEQLVTAGITSVAALVSWWKNNSFTAAAIQADAWMGEKKKRVN